MKRKTLIDAKVVADVSKGLRWIWNSTPEKQAKEMESLCSEFNDFVRDHRSMDWVQLYVEREYQDQCSHCNNEWEVDADGLPQCCELAQIEHVATQRKINEIDEAKP